MCDFEDADSVGPKDFFIGIVAPIGCESKPTVEHMEKILKCMGYSVVKLSMTSTICDIQSGPITTKCGGKQVTPSRKRPRGFDAYYALIVAGDKACKGKQDRIIDRCTKEALSGGLGTDRPTAYIISSLKRSEEIEFLRKKTDNCLIVALANTYENRIKSIVDQISAAPGKSNEPVRAQAEYLIHLDRNGSGEKKGTQEVNKCYEKADYFLNVDPKYNLEASVKRLLNLAHGHPFITPTREEYSMALAYTAKVRSSDFGKQVGCCLVTTEGMPLSIGTNEVAKYGGGQYWEDDAPDFRDRAIGWDVAHRERNAMISEVGTIFADAVEDDGCKEQINEVASNLDNFKSSRFMHQVEFGRVLHAEMAAITNAAMLGISIRGCIAVVTAFPCHMCMRLLLGVGASEVIYLEEFAKSHSELMYNREMNFDSESGDRPSVRKYQGVAPWVYHKCFEEQKNRSTASDGAYEQWQATPGVLNIGLR